MGGEGWEGNRGQDRRKGQDGGLEGMGEAMVQLGAGAESRGGGGGRNGGVGVWGLGVGVCQEWKGPQEGRAQRYRRVGRPTR